MTYEEALEWLKEELRDPWGDPPADDVLERTARHLVELIERESAARMK